MLNAGTPTKIALLLFTAMAFACSTHPPKLVDAGQGGGVGADPVACVPCAQSADCPSGGVCAQYSGSDFCAHTCANASDCSANEQCAALVASDGTAFKGCVPQSGSCTAAGCQCASGEHCDVISGACVSEGDGGNGLLPDGGLAYDAGGPPIGSFSGDGGMVSRLYFAVVGDTRPPIPDDTLQYPTTIITKIFDDLEAMNPKPQFVVATGDYMFADPLLNEGVKQVALYQKARAHFSGPVFAALGNHECNSLTESNCPNGNKNTQAFYDALVKPLGQSKLYYTIPFSDVNGQWTGKLIVTACNAWETTQKDWFAEQLNTPTTLTLIARHEPIGTTGPCNSDMDAMLQSATYDLLITGHVHSVSHTGNQIVEGVGGAPISGNDTYGYAIVEQLPTGGFRVTQYDYMTASPVDSYTIP